MKLSRSVAVVIAAVSGLTAAQGVSLPTVDLGYEVHQAIDFNVRDSHALWSVREILKLCRQLVNTTTSAT